MQPDLFNVFKLEFYQITLTNFCFQSENLFIDNLVKLVNRNLSDSFQLYAVFLVECNVKVQNGCFAPQTIAINLRNLLLISN